MDQIEISATRGTHVVVGAGTVGSLLASMLADTGADVVVVTRSGLKPDDHRIRPLALDAAATESLIRAVPSGISIYNCVNPLYHRWAKQWPPLARSFESYAELTGAVLVSCRGKLTRPPHGRCK